jgi:Aldehyde dehydrogenase family
MESAMNAPNTSPSAVDQSVIELRDGARDLAACSIDRKVDLAKQCVASLSRIASKWCEAGCVAKRTSDTAAGRAEEWLGGPVTTLRFLQLTIASFLDLKKYGSPQLPGSVQRKEGQLRVPVFPTRHLCDSLVFMGLRAETWLQPGVTIETMFGKNPARLLRQTEVTSKIALVLGAGNVSSIPATDALTKIFHNDTAVLLKLNPVNDYLGEIFQDALKPLIDAGWLRIIYGATAVGAYAIHHQSVDSVHITGSADSHEAIVWGSDPNERQLRKKQDSPLITKPISSELGNVTPWIVVPGSYSQSQLQAQAESIAASITNNASFNCIATKMIITCKQWPQRSAFLDAIQRLLNTTPKRYAYYPGAAERHRQFSGISGQESDDCLPWFLRQDVKFDECPELFQRESFVCVLGETSIGAGSPVDFLQQAVEFVNNHMLGTLAVGLTIPNDLATNSAVDQALRGLRYGTIGINQWSALGFAWMSSPWGGYPGASLQDIQSGIGAVHNTYLLEKPEKTVIYGKLKLFPKPVWFSQHSCPDVVTRRLFNLYSKPSLFGLPSLLAAALRG